MRTCVAKFCALWVVGFVAFGLIFGAPVKAQTSAEIQNAVNDAASGANVNAVKQLLALYPKAAIAIGDVLAGKMKAADTNSTASANLAAALVATGDAALISGVLVAGGMPAAAQASIATALSGTRNVSLIATVEALLPANSTVLALVANAAASVGLVIAQQTISVPAIVVIQPSPQQTCSGASCS